MEVYARSFLLQSDNRDAYVGRRSAGARPGGWAGARETAGSGRRAYRLVGREGDGVAVVRDVKRGTFEQRVLGLAVVDLYPDTASA